LTIPFLLACAARPNAVIIAQKELHHISHDSIKGIRIPQTNEKLFCHITKSEKMERVIV
jgi:hypothetical protein